MPGHDRNSSGPSTSTSSPSASTSTSHWHKIRPWAPHFILTIREITSVSATFILSSTLSSKDSQEAEDLVSGNISDDDLEDSAASTSVHVVSDALAKGFTVNVNGTPWKRSFIRMVDDGDEAIIILHGLIPGKRHDIEIGIDSGDGEEIVHTHMTTSKGELSPVKRILSTLTFHRPRRHSDNHRIQPLNLPSTPTHRIQRWRRTLCR